MNIPGIEQAEITDYLGIASGRKVDKLAIAGVEHHASELVDAPLLLGFPLVLECRLISSGVLGSHTMFVGEIMDVKCDEAILDEEDKPDFSRISSFVYSTADSTYYVAERPVGKGYGLGTKFQQ